MVLSLQIWYNDKEEEYPLISIIKDCWDFGKFL